MSVCFDTRQIKKTIILYTRMKLEAGAVSPAICSLEGRGFDAQTGDESGFDSNAVIDSEESTSQVEGISMLRLKMAKIIQDLNEDTDDTTIRNLKSMETKKMF